MVPMAVLQIAIINNQLRRRVGRRRRRAFEKVLGAPVVVSRLKASVWPLRPTYE